MGSVQPVPSVGVKRNTSNAPLSITTGDRNNKSAVLDHKDNEYTNPYYPILKGEGYNNINKFLDMMPTFVDNKIEAEVDAYTREL